MTISSIGNSGSTTAISMNDHAGRDTESATATTALLPSPSPMSFAGMDLMTELTAILVTAKLRDRESARTTREHQETALEKAEAAQITAMHDKADAMRVSGYVSAAFEAGTAACTIVSTSMSASAQMKKADADADGMLAKINPKDLTAQSEAVATATALSKAAIQTDKYSKLVAATGQGLGATEKALGGFTQGMVAEADTAASSAENEAKRAERGIQEARESSSQAREDLNAAIEWLRQMKATESATGLAALRA